MGIMPGDRPDTSCHSDRSHAPARCRTSEWLIGEVAKQAGVTPKAVRLYESMGLVAPPRRTEAGYRVYDEAHLQRLRFVVGAKRLGLTLHEIQRVIQLWESGESPCGLVARFLDEKLGQLNERLSALATYRDELMAFRAEVDRIEVGPHTGCRHIEAVLAGAWQPSVADAHGAIGFEPA
jgi:DNA-binding transcriptional MerR regulator